MAPAEHRDAFRAHVGERNLAAARVAALLVAALMPAGVVLDWITHPEMVGPFLPLRLAGSAASLGAFALSYVPWARRSPFALGVIPVLACTVPIEIMIESLEGYSSPYYAGLNLAVLGVGIVFTWSLREIVAVCTLVISVWLVPTLAAYDSLELGPFFNNLYFLLLTAVIAVAGNTSRYRLSRREFEARAEVARTSRELEAALSRLTELDRLKSEFFANISHELRTPLTLILAPVEDRLSRGAEGPDREAHEVVRRNAQRLLRLIDDLLDLSRIDAGRLRLVVGPVDLAAMAEQAELAFRPAASARGVRLVVEADPVEDVHGDPHRLEMVLSNLLGNALKFTPEGGTVTLRLGGDAGRVRLSVSDTGGGIAPEDLPRIFQRFYQASGSARRSSGGVGIGLALARELAELHGGTLEVESELGRGTTFVLGLPRGRDHFRPEVLERRRVQLDVQGGRRAGDRAAELAPAPEQRALPADDDDEPILLDRGRKPRVLLVEDQPELRELIRGLLEGAFEMSVAADGAEGLERILAERPDLVISDVMMPRTSGVELCAAVKADPRLRATPVVLLTAKSGSEAVLEGYASGADDFVTKPFHPRVLVARVRAQLRLRALSLQLAEQARLAAVGTLAAGVGHEVRNPVNAVVNGAEALLAREGLDAQAQRLLVVIADAGRRIERISAALLSHASPGDAGGSRPVDVVEGLDSTLRLLEHRLGTVAVHRTHPPSAKVIGSPVELNQVFLNLLDNALRADAKNLWIEVEEGPTLAVSIGDDGRGVPAEVAERIFDPFFTTRQPGEGTGLGLYLSRRIVAAHGGELRHAPREGGGARFTVELPREAR